MHIESVAKTDTGPRDHNEDSICWYPESEEEFQENNFFLVADGMGGVNAGEVASSLVVKSFNSFFAIERNIGDHVEVLRKVFRLANNSVLEYAAEHPETKGMGSTGVAIHFDERHVYIGHVGDSRCYRLREGRLEPLTKDHSYVQTLIDKGEIPEEERLIHPHKNIITRTIGLDSELEADISKHALQEGDVFLLCSDGLCGHISDKKIESVALQTISADAASMEELTSTLIDLANAEAGKDNVSVILVRVADIPADTGSVEAEVSAETALVGDEDAQTSRSTYGRFGVLLLVVTLLVVWRYFFYQDNPDRDEEGEKGYVVHIAAGNDREATELILGELEKVGWNRTQIFLRSADDASDEKGQNIFIWDLQGKQAAQELKEQLLQNGKYRRVEVESLPYSVQVGDTLPDEEWQPDEELELRKWILDETGYYIYWQKWEGGYRRLAEAFATAEEADEMVRHLAAAGMACKTVMR